MDAILVEIPLERVFLIFYSRKQELYLTCVLVITVDVPDGILLIAQLSHVGR